ncbi:MAG: hypothetical protein WCC87_21860 [Candidatus Korobacteraceae bacterium]
MSSDLITFWIGHATKTVTDDYVLQIRRNVAFRKKEAEAAGLGFKLPFGLHGLQTASVKAGTQAA